MHPQIIPLAAKLVEFVREPSGIILNGDCVETAMAVATGCVKGEVATPQDIIAIVESMQGAGIASSNGATSINNAHDWLVRQGYTISTYVPYAEPFGGDWLALLEQHAGANPIVLNIANGQALVDVETGSADEHGVQYHGIAVVGKQEDGFVCVDGDNPQANQRYQIYPKWTITAAQPCGMVVLSMPHTGGSMTLPDTFLQAGWSDDGTTLKGPPGSVDKQSHSIQGVLRLYALELINSGVMTPADTFLQDMQHDGPRYTVMTSFHKLIDPGDGTSPFIGNIGASLLLAEQQLANAGTGPRDPQAIAALAVVEAIKAAIQ